MKHRKFFANSSVSQVKPKLLRSSIYLAIVMMAASSGYSVHAQSITGGLHGSAPVESGVSVEVTSRSLGFARTVVPATNGHYRVDLLYPGEYTVRTLKDGKVLDEETVEVTANTSTTVPTIAAATSLGTVEVKADAATQATIVNPIDVTTPELAQVYDAKLVHDLPISQTSVYAPWAVDSAAATVKNLPQLGGASTAENRTYFNEFDTTYDVTGQGAFYLPQDAVASTTIIDGSAGLAWTSSTGGLASATMKQGSNEFHAGYTAIYTPRTDSFFSPAGRDVSSGTNAYTLYQSHNVAGESLNQDVWASGPILKDKLFFFAELGNSPPISHSQNFGASTDTVSSSRDKNYMANLTWDISDGQSLDVIGYHNASSNSVNTYILGGTYNPSAPVESQSWGGTDTTTKLAMANYHWQITDDLSLRLMTAYMRNDVQAVAADGTYPWVDVINVPTLTQTQIYGGSAQLAPNLSTTTKRGFKGDIDWTLGDHTLTFGADLYKDNYTQIQTTTLNGQPTLWWYQINNPPGSLMTNGLPVPADGNFVYTENYSAGGSFNGEQKGIYAYDTWQATSRLVLTGGVRWDKDTNSEANGATYLNLKVLSPRLGMSWDVFGDSSLKVGANVGRYTLPMPSVLSYFRAGSLYAAISRYSYTGMDPTTKAPLGLTPLGGPSVYSNGAVPDPNSLASQNLKNTSQNEFQLYFQKQLSPSWTLLGQFNATHLNDIVDSIDNNSLFQSYIQAHGYPTYNGAGIGSVVLFNPGQAIVLRGHFKNDSGLYNVTIPNSYLQMPAPQRTYYGLTFKLDHARTASEPYFLEVAYTWSHLYGNEDGYDNESRNTVENAGATGDYSVQQLTTGMFGDLAADIRDQLVMTGVYYFDNGLHVSAILNAHTGAPYGCFGTYPNPNVPDIANLTSNTHYCGTAVVPLNGLGRYPFYSRFDLGVGYDLSFLGANKLSINLLMTNVFNQHAITSYNTTYDIGAFSKAGVPIPSATYLDVNGLQAPRATMLTLRYQF